MKVRVGAFIIKDQHLLLLKYVYNGQVLYNLPGGNLEFGEQTSDCLARELLEELELAIEVGPIVAIVQVNQKEESKLHLIYQATILHGEPKVNSKETSAVNHEWMPLELWSEIHLYPQIAGHLKALALKQTNEVYLGEIEQAYF